MHVNEVALYLSETPDFTLCAAAPASCEDCGVPPYRYTENWNRQNVRDNYCGSIYDDYREMLDAEKPDIAFLLCENAQKPEIVSECARRKINVSIEKPMGASLADALEIKRVAEEAGIEAVVNWPVVWREYVHRMKAALDAGIVGTPQKLRYINGHTGPLGKGAKHRGVAAKAEEMTDEVRSKTWWHKKERGGGVFLDIACYGCFFSRWLMDGHEESVTSLGRNLNTPFGDTEDNFAALIGYAEDDKMAVIEGTWTTPRAVIPSGPMVVCSGGVVVCEGGAENAPRVAAYDIYGNEVEIPAPDFGGKYKNMPCHYANHVKTGEPIHPMLTLEENVRVMALIEAAQESSDKGQMPVKL